MAGDGVAPTVCISVDGNDISKVRRQEFFRRYREALGRIRDLVGTPAGCGNLPRRAADARWRSDVFAMNSLLVEH